MITFSVRPLLLTLLLASMFLAGGAALPATRSGEPLRDGGSQRVERATPLALMPERPAGPTAERVASAQSPPAHWPFSAILGVNYGNGLASVAPSVPDAIAQIGGHFGAVKLFGNNVDLPGQLSAARQHGLQVAIGTFNSQIAAFADPTHGHDAAAAYVSGTIAPNADIIKAIVLGNEPYTSACPTNTGTCAAGLGAALQTLIQALAQATPPLRIPVTTTISFGVTTNTYPPACGVFQPQFIEGPDGLRAVLNLLGSSGSFALVDIYPYLAYLSNPNDIPLAYALGTQGAAIPPGCNDPGGMAASLFEAQYDAFLAALKALALATPPSVFIGETGWPSGGGPAAATVANEQTYITAYVQYARAKSLPTFLFQMYDEDRKCTPDCDENHYGLFSVTGSGPGTPKFPIP